MEEQIVPAYYENRDAEGIPQHWLTMMDNSIKNLLPEYSTHRMLHDYCHDICVPAGKDGDQACANEFAQAKALASWKQSLENSWNEVSLETEVQQRGEIKRGQEITISTRAYLGRLRPEDVKVELFAGIISNGEITNPVVVELNYMGFKDGAHCYEGKCAPQSTGSFGYAVRALPTHPAAKFRDVLNFMRWSR